MPPSQELSCLTTELHHATQGFRLMLWHFTLLVPIFDRLKEARELHKMVQESIPPLMAFFAEIMGTDWNRPRIPAATQEVFTDLLRDLNAEGISSVVSEWIMGRQPLAVEFQLPKKCSPTYYAISMRRVSLLLFPNGSWAGSPWQSSFTTSSHNGA